MADARDEATLDPDDWDDFAATAHRALDLVIDHLRGVGEGPVWRPAPAAARDRFTGPLPRRGRDFSSVLDDVNSAVLPHGTGNGHPSFFGWVHGAGTAYGMVAEMLAAGLNANCGGRNHVAIDVERQIGHWAAQLLGYPDASSGVFVTGTSMANFLALLIARDSALGHDVRQRGLRESAALVAYASAEAHGCIGQAMELAGIGSQSLRAVAVNGRGEMDIAALRATIAADRAAGARPFLVVGTAGTVNTGAIDDLEAIGQVAAKEGLWFHVDGAFGALAALSPELKQQLKGIENSDSVAFDFHKWAHVPYDAGFVLVRDGAMHRATFASPAAYLQRLPRGLGAGETWPCDLGPDLSRGFRALKVWMTFEVLGAERIGAAIARCCALARRLESRLAASALFEPAAPVRLNIVCFRLRGPVPPGLHQEIVMDLQERGLAAPSMTIIGGEPVIRAAIVNHRTAARHVDDLLSEAEASARRVMAAHDEAWSHTVRRAKTARDGSYGETGPRTAVR